MAAKFAKRLLFTFNVLFWIAGVCSISVGLWIYFEPGRFSDVLGAKTFVYPSALLIATGTFITFVGFCGCFGAIQESKCMLATYFGMLLVVLCMELAAGVLGFVYRDDMRRIVTDKASSVIKHSYGTGDINMDHTVDLLQQTLQCCGAVGRADYQQSDWVNTVNRGQKTVPESCCSRPAECTVMTRNELVYNIGCVEAGVRYSRHKLAAIGAVGVLFGLLQCCGMVLSCVLYFSIDDYQAPYLS